MLALSCYVMQPTQLLLPFAPVLRMHACKGRIRAAAQTSDIEVQLSTAQLQAIARVAKAVFTCFEGGATLQLMPLHHLAADRTRLDSEPSLPAIHFRRPRNTLMRATSLMMNPPRASQAAVVDDIEAAAQLGQVIITLLEDSVRARALQSRSSPRCKPVLGSNGLGPVSQCLHACSCAHTIMFEQVHAPHSVGSLCSPLADLISLLIRHVELSTLAPVGQPRSMLAQG